MSLKKHIRLNNELASAGAAGGVVRPINETVWCLAIKLPAVEPVVDGISSGPKLMPSTTGSTAGRLYISPGIKRIHAHTHKQDNGSTSPKGEYTDRSASTVQWGSAVLWIINEHKTSETIDSGCCHQSEKRSIFLMTFTGFIQKQ